jgi:hypothetical protein
MPMTTQQLSRQHLRIACATGFAALTLLASACAGPTDEKKPRDGSASGNKADQALEYGKCLREQGLDVPEPKPGGASQGARLGKKDGMSKEKVEKALKACRGKGGGFGGGKEMTQADKDKAIKFAQCMRKNGVDMPDPKFDGGAQPALNVPKSGPEKTRFEKAIKTCESEAKGGNGSSTESGDGGGSR